MNKNLIKKSEIIEGLDVDKYLKEILGKYETFYFNESEEFNNFLKEIQGRFMVELLSESFRRKIQGDRRLDILNKFERKIAKRQKKRDIAIEEKRKYLILAIKKIKW